MTNRRPSVPTTPDGLTQGTEAEGSRRHGASFVALGVALALIVVSILALVFDWGWGFALLGVGALVALPLAGGALLGSSSGEALPGAASAARGNPLAGLLVVGAVLVSSYPVAMVASLVILQPCFSIADDYCPPPSTGEQIVVWAIAALWLAGGFWGAWRVGSGRWSRRPRRSPSPPSSPG